MPGIYLNGTWYASGAAPYYGATATAAATAAKVVPLSGFTSAKLVVGAEFVLVFTSGSTSATMSLNIQSTGAKTVRNPRTFAAQEVGRFIYDGAQFICVPFDTQERVLFTFSGGTASNFETSDSAANYDAYRFDLINNDGITSSVYVANPNGKNVALSMVSANQSGATFIKSRMISINGTSVTNYGTRYSETLVSGSTASATQANNVWITQVVGIKRG